MDVLRVALCQINPTVGDLSGNVEKMKDVVTRAVDTGARLIVFPELAICGYPPRDTNLYRDINVQCERAETDFTGFLRKLQANCIVVWGNIRRGVGLRNSAKVFLPLNISSILTPINYQDKRELPNYMVFDEARNFRKGDDEPSKLFSSSYLKFGLTVCEDIWYQQNHLPDFALNGAQVVVNINASPFHIGKPASREAMIKARAADNQVFVLYCNMVGGQDGVVFDGHSMVVGPSGNLVARADLFKEQILYADIDLNDVERVRLRDARLNSIARPKAIEVVSFDSYGFAGNGRTMGNAVKDEPQFLSEIAQIHDALVLMIRDYMRKQGLNGAVIGLSGGVDSSLCAALAVEALGAEHVVGIAMPSKYSSEESLRDARELSCNLGIELRTVPIQPEVDAYLAGYGAHVGGIENAVTAENIQARVRGAILMMYSNDHPGVIVLSTGNKSEVSCGYCTLHGDMVGGFNPLLDLYKTDVYCLASYVNERAQRTIIPQAVLEKPPSAELKPNQKDTDSLPPYDKLDPILRLLIEECMTSDEIIAAGYHREYGLEAQEIDRIANSLVKGSEFKRQQAVVGSRISPIAFGIGRRMPIVNKFRM